MKITNEDFNVKKTLTLMLFGFSLAACGGGGVQSSSPAPAATPTSSPAGTSSVSFVFDFPLSGSQAQQRRPEFLSARTQSIVNAIDGTVSTLSVGPTAPNCSAVSPGLLQCTANFALGAGTHTYVFVGYDQPNGNGNQLSYASGSFTTVAGVHNTPTVTVNGVIRFVRVTTNPRAIANLAGITLNLNVDGLDPDGTVISSGIYVDSAGTPRSITLSDNDTSGSVKLSQTTLTGPTTGITATYDGVHSISNLIINGVVNCQCSVSPGQATVAVSQGPTETYVISHPGPNASPPPGIVGYALPLTSTSFPNFNVNVGTGANLPIGVAFDYTQSANMAISFAGSGVAIYPGGPGASTLPAPVQLLAPADVYGLAAFDLNGNVFVGTGSVGKSVLEYDPINGVFTSNQAATATVTDPMLTSPYGVCFDYMTSPNLYVTNNDSTGTIVEFSRNASGVWTKTLSIIVPVTTQLPKLGGCREDPYTNKLVVADNNRSTVFIYTLPLTANSIPAQQSVTAGTGAGGFPLDVLLLQNVLYVTLDGPNAVAVYGNPPTANPTVTVTNGIGVPFGIGQNGF